jgi:peptidoglycan/LPS O-acetylase OafA/YrhL
VKYRPEIDGLRAIAIVPVVLFHSGVKGLQGGYLGVDIFFVISGYLITSIIYNDLLMQKFSIATFYERRIRRIIPAYVVMIVTCTLFAWLWMMPDQLRNFGQSVFASAIFASNILFWTEAGYFVAGSAEKPLLHTWSLSVEEQFYIVFPLLLMIVAKIRPAFTLPVIVLLSIVSISLSEYGWRNIPSANFYMLPFRAWELGVGAMVALIMIHHQPSANVFLSAFGLVLVSTSIMLFDESTPMPSVYGLIPVIGTALIIMFTSSENLVGKILSRRAIVLIGLISYSTYLWHQPLLAFARIRSIPSSSDGLLLSLGALSFVLGYLSWRYVERPFRKDGIMQSITQNQMLIGGVATLAILGAVGLVGHSAAGFPSRLPEVALKLSAFTGDRNPLESEDRCAFYHARPLPAHPIAGCDMFLNNGKADVIFIGDSHSGSISYDAQILLSSSGISSYAVSYSGCIGFRGFTNLGMPRSYDCNGYNESMIRYAREMDAKVLVVTSRFPLYLYGDRFDNREGGVEIGHKVHYERSEGLDDRNEKRVSRKELMLKGFRDELVRLAEEFHVILLDPIPEAGWYVPQLAAKVAMYEKLDKFNITTKYERYVDRAGEIIAAFDSVKSNNITRIRPQEVLCNGMLPGRCLNANESVSLYFDNNHPTRTAARLIAPHLLNGVTKVLANKR